uniref:Uncharacterized protein n=1 Tax=Glossina palpalis gambiensis TaxID=67801 RepID=A0A1B0B6J8_9MUSC
MQATCCMLTKWNGRQFQLRLPFSSASHLLCNSKQTLWEQHQHQHQHHHHHHHRHRHQQHGPKDFKVKESTALGKQKQ